MRIESLGDQALMTYWDDEGNACSFAEQMRSRKVPGLLDVVQAYQSVALYFDVDQLDLLQARQTIEPLARSMTASQSPIPGRLHIIPCCYSLGPDLEDVVRLVGSTIEAVIQAHTQTVYTIYAIGFRPGFPYLGYLPPLLAGIPRKKSPRLRVEAGSVGVTGRQTGIYPEPSPGGWNLISRTPLCLVDVASGYFPLHTGDRIQFQPIDAKEFEARRGERLPTIGDLYHQNRL